MSSDAPIEQPLPTASTERCQPVFFFLSSNPSVMGNIDQSVAHTAFSTTVTSIGQQAVNVTFYPQSFQVLD